MKETYYFPHDSNAIQDPKMMVLLSECGLSGIGMYWILIEILHQQEEGKISEEAYNQYIKFYHGVNGGTYTADKIKQVLNTSGLLLNKDGFIYSERVLKNKEYRQDISNKRSFAGKKSAEARANPTNVKQNSTHDEQGKERKGKEIKVNEIKRKEESTIVDTAVAEIQYGNKEINGMLLALKEKIGVEAFADSSIERNMAKHCVNLIGKIGKDEFVRRLDFLLSDDFHSRNCNKIKYVYNQIKGFKQPNVQENPKVYL